MRRARSPSRLKGNPQSALKEQYSALEESRADLVALYFLPNPKLAELGLVDVDGSSGDRAGRVRGLRAQRARAAAPHARRHADRGRPHAQPPDDRAVADGELEGDRRAASATARRSTSWSIAKAFQEGVGRLLAEVQRIKSEGDYEAAKALFETYGVHFDPKLRDEIVARVDHLNMPSYTGFVQPKLDAVTGRGRHDHRRQDLLSDGSDDADAGVLRPERVAMRAFRRAQGAGAAIAAIAGVLAAALIVGLAGRQARLLAGPAVLAPALQTGPSPGLIGVLAIEDARAPLPERSRARCSRLARSGNVGVQRAAVRALGRLERRDVVTDLLQYLHARDPGVSEEAASSLLLALRGEPVPGVPAEQQTAGCHRGAVGHQFGGLVSGARPAPVHDGRPVSAGRTTPRGGNLVACDAENRSSSGPRVAREAEPQAAPVRGGDARLAAGGCRRSRTCLHGGSPSKCDGGADGVPGRGHEHRRHSHQGRRARSPTSCGSRARRRRLRNRGHTPDRAPQGGRSRTDRRWSGSRP